MGAKGGPAPDHLSFLVSAGVEARRYGVFALLRTAEALSSGLPRIGRSRMPSQNIADLAHTHGVDFPGPTVDEIETGRTGRFRVRSRFLGLTGPMGPLPLYITEYAHLERKYRASRPFGALLDMLTDRMLQFFFRAWADSQPSVQADRPADDRFATYLSNLTGAVQNVGDDASFPARARLHYAALYTGRRSAAALQDNLSHLIGRSVKVVEFVGRRRKILREDQTRIGASGAFQQLGQGAVIGPSVRQLDDTFRVIVRAESMAEYRAMLPGGRWFAIAREALSAFAPGHLDWELELAIDQRHVQPATLNGEAQLGWASWLAPGQDQRLRTDARLRRHD